MEKDAKGDLPQFNQQEPELTDEDIKMMASRVASAPLPRALEYLASLPDYYPVPMEGLLDMDYRGEHHVTVRPPNDEQESYWCGQAPRFNTRTLQ